jgi:hypothetical protein
MPTQAQFSAEKRATYLKETSESLEALLDDAFLGDDQNEIKTEFPEGSQRKDIIVSNTRISLNYMNGSEVPLIEVELQISYKNELIGEYKSVYGMDGELQDEYFYLD